MTARRPRPARLALQGTLWLSAGGRNLGGHGRMALLRAVVEHGSITQAAKAYGISYKAAWDAIDTMNRVAGEPLVERSSGGRGGGSTRLTERGRRLLERYGEIDAAHQRFVRLLDAASIDLTQDFSLLNVLNMKTSARNQFVGTVSSVRAGAVNDEVELTLPGGTRIVAIVTHESTRVLGLRTAMTAIALVKASAVVLAADLGEARVSARNLLAGTVASVVPGAVNAEVTLELEGSGTPLVAIVTQESVAALGLAPGRRATALVQASDVILAVAA